MALHARAQQYQIKLIEVIFACRRFCLLRISLKRHFSSLTCIRFEFCFRCTFDGALQNVLFFGAISMRLTAMYVCVFANVVDYFSNIYCIDDIL